MPSIRTYTKSTWGPWGGIWYSMPEGAEDCMPDWPGDIPEHDGSCPVLPHSAEDLKFLLRSQPREITFRCVGCEYAELNNYQGARHDGWLIARIFLCPTCLQLMKDDDLDVSLAIRKRSESLLTIVRQCVLDEIAGRTE